jgi:two-component system response regulator TctD
MQHGRRGRALARVLVVDDDDIVLKALVSVLRRLGHEVEGTSSGQAALEHVRRDLPDLLVLDYRLPDMDGEAVYRHVLALFGDNSPPVLFVSGSPIEEVAAKVSPAGRAAFLQKPFDFRELADRVDALLAV